MNTAPLAVSPLRRERLRAGLSQLSLATQAGCSLSTVSLAERGAGLSTAMAERLANVLGCTVEDLTYTRSSP
jgi:transcriptional regulator with XRE-family HTH domain